MTTANELGLTPLQVLKHKVAATLYKYWEMEKSPEKDCAFVVRFMTIDKLTMALEHYRDQILKIMLDNKPTEYPYYYPDTQKFYKALINDISTLSSLVYDPKESHEVHFQCLDDPEVSGHIGFLMRMVYGIGNEDSGSNVQAQAGEPQVNPGNVEQGCEA